MEITLKSGRKIGDGHPPYLIAEVGSNWRDLNDCLNSIVQAKNCGADAVKFQLFTPWDLYGIREPGPEEPIGIWDEEIGTTSAATAYSLPRSCLPKLKEHADKAGIDFMCTAFSPELYDVVDPYVEMHKVASSEMCHLRILERLRDYRKPVILSTGAQTGPDIGNALSRLGFDEDYNAESNPPVILLYCVAAYPARSVEPSRIWGLRQTFGALVGYSDHTVDWGMIPVYAVKQYQATILEKHFTVIPEVETPDREHSLNPEEFGMMTRRIRESRVEAAEVVEYEDGSKGIGGVDTQYALQIGPTREELPMILRHKRRLIATQDLKKGETFREGENFGIYRSLKDDTHALHPFAVSQVNGKHATKTIQAGDGIGPGDFT